MESIQVPKITVIGPTTSASLSLSNLKKDLTPSITISLALSDQSTAEINASSSENGTTAVDPINIDAPTADASEPITEAYEKSAPMKGETIDSEVFEEGWDFNASKSISIGELFLKTGGTNQTLDLQYTWKQTDQQKSSSAFSFLSKLASTELTKKPNSSATTISSPKVAKILSFEPQSPPNESGNSQATNNGSSNSSSNNSSNIEEPEFRRPSLPLSKPTIQQHQAFRQQMENLMPKYNMRKGRPLSRPKRALSGSSVLSNRPLQPAPTIKGLGGQVKVRIMPQLAPRSITVTHPVISIQQSTQKPIHLSNNLSSIVTLPSTPSIQIDTAPIIHTTKAIPISTASIIPSVSTTMPNATNNHLLPPKNLEIENTNSNDSIAAALNFFDTSRSDQFLDSVLETSNSSVLQTPPRVRATPPSSPSRHASNSDSSYWIPDLSAFLAVNHGTPSNSVLSTPTKDNIISIINNGNQGNSKVTPPILNSEDSVQSNGSEVDRQLLSMMSENSVDFTSKFAKLASAVVGNSHEDN